MRVDGFTAELRARAYGQQGNPRASALVVLVVNGYKQESFFLFNYLSIFILVFCLLVCV